MEAMHLVRRSASPIQLILMLCSIHWLAEGKRLESATSRLRLTSRSIMQKYWSDETRVFWSTAGGCDQSIDRLPLAVPLIDRFERLKTSFNEGRGGNPFIREVCVCITMYLEQMVHHNKCYSSGMTMVSFSSYFWPSL